MKNLIKLSALFALFAVFTSTALAQTSSADNQTQNQKLNKYRVNWVDIDGNGICDNFGTENQGAGNGYGKLNNNVSKGKRGGLGDGSGLRPQDGTGFGRGNASGAGVCDGTGPKGNISKGRRN